MGRDCRSADASLLGIDMLPSVSRQAKISAGRMVTMSCEMQRAIEWGQEEREAQWTAVYIAVDESADKHCKTTETPELRAHKEGDVCE